MKWEIPVFDKPVVEISLREEMCRHASNLDFIDCSDTCRGVFIKVSKGTGEVERKITVENNGNWDVYIKGKKVPKSCSLFKDIPMSLTNEEGIQLLNLVITSQICEGNTDFPDVFDNMRKDVLLSKDRKSVVGYKHDSTIRSLMCDLIVPANLPTKCEVCLSFRDNLRARSSRLKRKQESNERPSPHTPFDSLNTPDKRARFDDMSSKIHLLQKQVQRLTQKVLDMIESESVETTQEQHSLLSEIATEHNESACSTWPEGSPQRLLWEEQVKRSKVKSSVGMRWHPLMIKWCISLHCASPKAYRQVANSGFLKLPSLSTLKSYMKFTTPCPGFNEDVIRFLIKETNIANLKDHQKNVVLVWDEMKIKSGLVSSKSTGKLIGFCEIGDFNEELTNLSQRFANVNEEPELATHILVFMVRGIMADYNLPFIWFPCRGFMSEDLWSSVWNATRVLENIGFLVRAWVCDGATPNRKFFRIQKGTGGEYKGNTYFTVNRYDTSRNIYFICDPPHLLKTTRNNLENSHGHNNTKSLVCRGKNISWAHITCIVRRDKELVLNRLPKLKEEHSRLSPQLRMRVHHAAQVLSKSMANALRESGNPEYTETAVFCEMMDRWFDCLNGRYLSQGQFTRKPELAPYRSKEDWRFNWLNQEFLDWLEMWEEDIKGREGLTKGEKSVLFLSYQTVEGLRITTKSFVELIPQILSQDQSLFVLPEKINQDKLELMFGKLRRSLGNSDNPTVQEASYRMLHLFLAGSVTAMPSNTNCTNFDTGEGFQLKRCQYK